MMLLKLLAQMDRSRFENVVVSMTGSGSIGPELEAAGIRVLSLGMTHRRVEPAALFRLRRMLSEERPDALQTWLYHADLLGTLANLLGRRSPLLWNIRVSVMETRHYSRLLPLILRVLALLSGLPRVIIVNSRTALDDHVAHGYSPRSWQLIPNGFSTELFRPRFEERSALRRRFGIDPEARVVGHIARYDPLKDHATFFASAAIVRSRMPDVRFVLAGRGVVRENGALWSDVVKWKLEDAVILLGEVRDTASLYPTFDVFCLSSAFGEAFPNVLGEAMASGLTCVATDIGDSRSIIGDSGAIVPPRNAEALASALIAKLALPGPERHREGLLARERIEQSFSMTTVVEQYQRLYEGIAVGPPAKRSKVPGVA